MSLSILVLVCGSIAANPGVEVPVVTGIWPPGVTLGTRQRWTISGRYLQPVNSVIATGEGLLIHPPAVQADGRSLTVEVEARADSTIGSREIRVDGPSGISNLALVRVDSLPQILEVEPNDRTPAPGQIIPVGTAVVGTIRVLDVDHFRVEGTPGQRVTLDWETRRLGTAIIPVMTITGPNQTVIRQVRSSRGGDRDCRAAVNVPPEGWFAVELRDNTFSGDDRARYRLRVDPATGSSPQAGSRAAVSPTGGQSIVGRINSPGQVDRYRVEVKKGERLRARVEAAAAGSWLDSVVTVLGPHGERLGENDDRPSASPLEPPTMIDGSPSTDSEVDVEIKEDGPITVEVADRFDSGGPEFGYRLELGPPRNDFAIFVLPDPNANDLAAEARLTRATNPGAYGSFNLPPGSTTSVPFLIVPQGRPGSVEVRVEGLPAGVEAEPVTVRLAPAPRPGSRAAATWDAPPVVDSFRLRVRPDAGPVLGQFRVIARAKATDGSTLDREAVRVVGVDSAGGLERPVIRRLDRFFVRVLPASDP